MTRPSDARQSAKSCRLATLAAGVDLAETISATRGWAVVAVRGSVRHGYRVVVRTPGQQRVEVASLANWITLRDL
jgi:hypothetical protein